MKSFQIRRPHLKVEQPKSVFAEGNARWTNRDLDPVPPQDRHWGATSFLAYWTSDAWNPATWQFASSIIAVGLSWRESLGIVALSFFIVSWVIAFNGAIGVLLHVPFPVIARASWGFWGSYVAIISRAILAVFWYAVQTMNGANTVRVMLGAIWPSFLRLHNPLPASADIDTQTMICFFLFWLIQVPFLLLHPNQLRWLFMAKSIIVPIAWIAILGWALGSTDSNEIFKQKATIGGVAYSWAFLASMTSVIGNYATLSVNQSDFSRYSRISVKWQAIYVPFLPIIFTFIAFIGIAAASAGAAHYGTFLWDPMALVANWESRAARFFAAFNLSAANDLMALVPRFINIRRGQLLTAVFCWALVPWKILASAGSFLNFMSAYAIFLGPIAAIMLFDFYVVHGRKYDILALYNPNGIYRYSHGVNWRAIVAFLIDVAPSMPGFINGINHNIDVGVGVHPYQFGWLLGFVSTALVYTSLSLLLPAKETFIDVGVGPDEVFAQQGVAVEEHSDIADSDQEKQGFRRRIEKFL